jgi:hypothetical protein
MPGLENEGRRSYGARVLHILVPAQWAAFSQRWIRFKCRSSILASILADIHGDTAGRFQRRQGVHATHTAVGQFRQIATVREMHSHRASCANLQCMKERYTNTPQLLSIKLNCQRIVIQLFLYPGHCTLTPTSSRFLFPFQANSNDILTSNILTQFH